jgi:hypothetical protein
MSLHLTIPSNSFPLPKMPSSGMLRRVAIARTNVSEERITSIIMVTRIGEQGKKLAVSSNGRTLRRNTKWAEQRAYVVSYG